MESIEAVELFLKGSVKQRTGQQYERHWAEWSKFLVDEAGVDDPLLSQWREADKSTLVSLFLLRRHERGMRDKQATAATAGVRHHLTRALQPTDFMDAAVVTAARTACQRSTEELRQKKDNGRSATVKLPLCESVLARMRGRLWEGSQWDPAGTHQRMLYLGCMYAYDLSARVSEYTAPEKGHEDHCVRARDLTFELSTDGVQSRVRGGAAFFDGTQGLGRRVIGCWVSTSSNKTGSAVATKLISRRSPEESQFLDDTVEWLSCARVQTDDRLFTYRTGATPQLKRELTGRMVRDILKATCVVEDLDPEFFSSHSLRKAAITHMRALGVSDEDMRSRGGYAPGSLVMSATYDYTSAGHGPLSSNSLRGGDRPDVVDVRRHIPDHLGGVGEGDR